MHRRERREREVTAIFEGLGQEGEAKELTAFLENQALRLERPVFLELLREIYNRIREYLTNGSFLVVVRAVAQLIQVEFLKEESSKAAELVAFITPVFDRVAILESSIRDRVLESAVDSFGRLVKSGGAVTIGEIGKHIEHMLQLLNESDTLSSTVALRLLAELAKNAPTRFNSYADKFIAKAYGFLFHDESAVRQDALEALKGCLGVVALRASGKRHGWFQDLAHNLMAVVAEPFTPKTLRALVALRCVIQHTAGNLLSLFPYLSEMVVSLMAHSEAAVQEEVIEFIPVLAQMCPQNYAQSLWRPSMDYFITHLQNRIYEAQILEAIGKLVEVLVSIDWVDVKDQLKEIARALRTILRDNASPRCSRQAAVKTIGELAKLLRKAWKEEVLKMFPVLMAEPVDSVLLTTAHQVVEVYPEMLPAIQSAFLRFMSPSRFAQPVHLLMVYSVLSTFPFEHSTALLRHVADSLSGALSNSSDIEMRSTAAKACLNILANHTNRFAGIHSVPSNVPTGETGLGDEISELVDVLCDHLTTSAVMDISDDLRSELFSEMCVHEELHQRFAQDVSIRRLSYALYDTCLPIRQSCVQLMGHLASHNFAAVLPLMRELLLKLMEDLAFQGDTTIAASVLTDSALLLRTLLMEQSRLTEPMLPQILEALLHRLETYAAQKTTHRSVKDPTSAAICSLLLSLIEVLRSISQSLIRLSISRVASMLMSLMKDSNDRQKQLTSMKVVGKICEVTGEGLLQHMKASDLMACLTDLKNSTQDFSTLDPVVQSLSQWDSTFLSLVSTSDNTPELSEMKPMGEVLMFPTDEATVGDEEYYTSAAIHASLTALEDTRNTDYEGIIKCLMSIFGRLQKSGVFYLQRVIPVLAKIVRDADDKLRLVLFQHLSDLVRIAGEDVGPYCDPLMLLCLQFWSDSSAQSVHILNLMAELARAAQGYFATFLKELIPRLGAVLSNPADFQLVEPSLGLLQACNSQIGGFLPVLFPILIQFLRQVPIYEDPIPLNIQREVLKTLRHVLLVVEFREEEKYLMASKLYLSLIELLRREESLRPDTEDTLTVTISVLGPKISRVFAQQIQKALGETDEGSRLQLGLQRLVDPQFDDTSVYTPDEISGLSTISPLPLRRLQSHPEMFQLNIVELANSWDTADRSTREDWEEWMRGLSVEFLRQSPSPALHACHCLAQINPSVAKWLFKYSLLSIWSRLDEIYRQQLQEALQTVLMTPAMPLEVVQPIVGLGEYLNFIEQQEVTVASELTSLDSLAQKCSSYSTVLHYRMRPL